MAKQETDKSGFLSRFGAGYIAPAQFLAESMCDRIARSRREKLGPKFWNEEPWKAIFLTQLAHANRLLKKFRVEAIIMALRKPQLAKAYSFGGKWLLPYFEIEQKKLDTAQENMTMKAALKVVPPEPIRLPPTKSTTLSKLKELDR